LTSKRTQLNVRMSPFTEKLMNQIVESTGQDKSFIVREAIEILGVHLFGQEEINKMKLDESHKISLTRFKGLN